MATARPTRPNNPPAAQEAWFGWYKELGKTEARQSFRQILDDLKNTPTLIAITDRGEKVAVIMGYKHFQILLAILNQHRDQAGKNPLAGLIRKVGNLDKGKKKVGKLFQDSFKRTRDSI